MKTTYISLSFWEGVGGFIGFLFGMIIIVFIASLFSKLFRVNLIDKRGRTVISSDSFDNVTCKISSNMSKLSREDDIHIDKQNLSKEELSSEVLEKISNSINSYNDLRPPKLNLSDEEFKRLTKQYQDEINKKFGKSDENIAT